MLAADDPDKTQDNEVVPDRPAGRRAPPRKREAPPVVEVSSSESEEDEDEAEESDSEDHNQDVEPGEEDEAEDGGALPDDKDS